MNASESSKSSTGSISRTDQEDHQKGFQRRWIVAGASTALLASLLIFLGAQAWSPSGSGESSTAETSPATQDAMVDDLFLTTLPQELCQQIADEFEGHHKSAVTQRDEGDPETRSRAYCQVYPEDVDAVAATGEPYLLVTVDVRTDAQTLMTEEGATSRAPVIPTDPESMDVEDWLAFLDGTDTVDGLYPCEGTADGCDGEVLTVPCQAFEFSATYINMQVYYGLRTCNYEEFDQQQAAESYGAVFGYVAGTLPRESALPVGADTVNIA